jgi:hypothetical protein
MRAAVLRYTALAAVVLTFGACRDEVPEASLVPPDYSPNYTHVHVVSEDGRQKRILVPEACLTPDEQSPADTGPERVPPGCANNYNLQRMAERKRDVIHGRRPDPAPAAPAARAAQRYIDGRDKPVLGGGVREDNTSGSGLDAGSGSPSPAPTPR